MKNHLFYLLAVWLVIAHGLTYQALCATPENQKDAKGEQEKEWEKTDRYSTNAVKAFLACYPKGDMSDVIRERLALMQQMEAIQDGNQSSLVIPFSMLAPWVEKWAEQNNEKTVALYSAVKERERITYGVESTLAEPGAVTIMRRGFMCAPLGQGTIIAFRTNGLKFTWPEGITFVSDANSTLFFGVLPKKGGLVFLKGKGKFIKLDGKEVTLSETGTISSDAQKRKAETASQSGSHLDTCIGDEKGHVDFGGKFEAFDRWVICEAKGDLLAFSDELLPILSPEMLAE
jgi:hypothetical protein